LNDRDPRPIKSYADLRVWQLGMDLAEEAYHLTENFLQREWYGLAGQIRRAAVPVPSNIAEGHTRESTREYIQHVSIARSSLTEVETQLKLASRLGFVPTGTLDPFLERATSLGRQLTSLRDALRRSERRSPAPSP
jgi:four helix bundle protein